MIKKTKNLSLLLPSTSLFIYMFVNKTYAATKELCSGDSSTFLGLPTWYKYLKPDFVDGRCELGAQFPEDLGKVGLALVEILLRLGGLVAVAFVIYGGFKYITSQGEPENTKNARATILNSVIGLIITIIATAVVSFIGSEFTK